MDGGRSPFTLGRVYRIKEAIQTSPVALVAREFRQDPSVFGGA